MSRLRYIPSCMRSLKEWRGTYKLCCALEGARKFDMDQYDRRESLAARIHQYLQ